jgi:dihydrofolate reductase
MSKLVITENMTLDGSIEMLDPWFDPQLQADDLLAESLRQGSESDAMLLGRQTFEDFRGYWPAQTEDRTGITEYLNSVAKYVVSSTLDDPGWQNTTILRGDPVPQVQELKSAANTEIVLTGSIRLAHTLIRAGIVDEYRMFVYPAVQGRGRPFFPDGTRATLTPIAEPMRFSSGIVLLRYAPAG